MTFIKWEDFIEYSVDDTKLICLNSFLFPLLCSTESVYDLLPKELQLPPSRETSVASMSQTSGGEAGSPPPAVVAAGNCIILFFPYEFICIKYLFESISQVCMVQ
uniref:Uncharacterized protein n=1 Tax=Dromaius novaehollandiae TaxID=8790 RepID=A0A8C4J9V6_DRONO